jgi:hypothetical protein
MRLGRPLVPLELTTEEQTLLESWARRRTTAQALALRARILLRAAAGDSNTAIARHERVTKATVGKWRARFGSASTGWSMNRGLGRRDRSATRTSSA